MKLVIPWIVALSQIQCKREIFCAPNCPYTTFLYGESNNKTNGESFNNEKTGI